MHLYKHPPKYLQTSDEAIVMNFFNEIYDYFKNLYFPNNESNLVFILVCHIVPTLPYYLNALQRYGTIGKIIAKTSSKNSDLIITNWLKENYPQIYDPDITKEMLQDSEKAARYLHENIPDKKRGVVIDIGGYFSYIKQTDINNFNLSQRLIGFVEDTRNGDDKYSNRKFDLPVYSVAGTRLKRKEAIRVGIAIVDATKQILSAYNKVLTDELNHHRKKIGIIGFGPIGQAIANTLMRNINGIEIYVYDSNEEVANKIYGANLRSVRKQDILNHCGIIFCATGNGSLNIEDFYQLVNHVYIISATSADDEYKSALFDLLKNNPPEDLPTSTPQGEVSYIKQITIETNDDAKIIYLLNNGDPVNFLFKGVVGDPIYAVFAQLIEGVMILAYKQNDITNSKIITPSENQENEIEAIWKKHFKPHPLENFDIANPHYYIYTQINSCFTGRETKLTNLANNFNLVQQTLSPNIQLIHGLGGCGKSSLALRYAQMQIKNKRYNAILWINAENKDSLQTDFYHAALRLGFDVSQNYDGLDGKIIEYLSKIDTWLIIFDNVINIELIAPYIPMITRGNILLTSQNSMSGNNIITYSMEISEFSREESIKFLTKRLPNVYTDNDLNNLAEILGDLPLALEQACCYILSDKPSQSIRDYIDNFSKSRKKLWQHERGPIDHKKTIFLTLQLNIEYVKKNLIEHCKNDCDIFLHFLAFLNSQNIPHSLFEKLFPEPFVRKEILKNFKNFHIINANNDESYNMHRLVQLVLRDMTTNNENLKNAFTILAKAFHKLFDLQFQNKEQISSNIILINHILSFFDYLDNDNFTLNQNVILLRVKLAKFMLYRQSRYESANQQIIKAEEDFVKSQSTDVKLKIDIYFVRSMSSYHRREHVEASNYLIKALEAYKNNLPNNILDVDLETLVDMLSCLQHLSLSINPPSCNLIEIATKLEKIISISNLNDKSKGQFYVILGQAYETNGQFVEAKESYQTALELFSKNLNITSLDLANCHNELGFLAFRKKEYENAIYHFKNALKIKQEKLGNSNHDIANILFNIAECYRHLENPDYQKALFYCQKSLEVFEENKEISPKWRVKIYDLLQKIYSKLGNNELKIFYANKLNEVVILVTEQNNTDSEIIHHLELAKNKLDEISAIITDLKNPITFINPIRFLK